jgi:hypothetical protein
VDIVMMRTPDGHGKLELTKFHNPKMIEVEPAIAAAERCGPAKRHVHGRERRRHGRSPARLGAELIGEVVQYEDKYRLCYMRGPAGIIVALAEELS